jgi:hypothetical protein
MGPDTAERKGYPADGIGDHEQGDAENDSDGREETEGAAENR